jgi:hypothetical protein
MTIKRLGLLSLLALSVSMGCADVSTMVSPDADVLFARNPGGDRAKDNKSCENPTSGSPVRNAPKEKNQCDVASPITFTVTNNVHIGLVYVGADCNTAGVAATGEGPFYLCGNTSVKLASHPTANVRINFNDAPPKEGLNNRV